MIYFDHASTSLPKPDCVKQAMISALDECGNPARGAHAPSLQALRTLTAARQSLAALVGLSDASRVVFTANATAALNLAISALHGHVVTTAAEHNSVLRPLYRRGNFNVVSVNACGQLDVSRLFEAVRSDTQAIVMTHASNVLGNVYDIAAVGAFCRANNLLFIVDAAQSAGLLALEMDTWGMDALCLSGHKALYSPQGIGALCLSARFSPVPLSVGGSGIDSFSHQPPAQLPERLEAGTQNAHAAAGLHAGIQYVAAQQGRCLARANELAGAFVTALREMGGYRLYGDLDAAQRMPVVLLNHPRLDSAALADALWQQAEIAVRAGAHCAPLMHRALGTRECGAVRFSFSMENTQQELAQALGVLYQLL